MCRTPLAAGVAQNFVNLSLDILLVVALGVGVVSIRPFQALNLCPPSYPILLTQVRRWQALCGNLPAMHISRQYGIECCISFCVCIIFRQLLQPRSPPKQG